jgi:hypothetical protein
VQLGMSALGQKQTFAPQNVMSALPPKADIQRLWTRACLSSNQLQHQLAPHLAPSSTESGTANMCEQVASRRRSHRLGAETSPCPMFW